MKAKHLWISLSAFLIASCSQIGDNGLPDATPPVSTITQPPSLTTTALPAPTETAPLPATPIPGTPPPAASPSASPVPATPTSFPALQSESLPDPAAARWELLVQGLSRPVGIAHTLDGSGRIFVLEQEGRIRILQEGQLLPAPFLDISDRVGSGALEQGLLGLAFHPGYADNGSFFVNYTDRQGNTVIARYRIGADPNQADRDSETALLRVEQPFGNHNGGGLAFGPDGYLYIGLGDGGSGGDPLGNAQSLNTHLGKLLRIDVDQGDPYDIPADNPFLTGEGRPEIWAYGLRNPWRFSFDRATGDLYIGDVGQNSFEEINFLPAGSPGGSNFGWNYREATHPFQGTPPSNLELLDPVFEYSLSQGNCSVIGGYVYRGTALPAWQGVYLFGDYCSGRVWGLLRDSQGNWQNGLLFQTEANISAFGQDEAGEIYMADRRGMIYRLVP